MTSITETFKLDDIRNLKGVFLADAVRDFLPAGSSKLKADEKRDALAALWSEETSKKIDAETEARKVSEGKITAEPIAPEILKIQTEGRTLRPENKGRSIKGGPLSPKDRETNYRKQTGKPYMTPRQYRRYLKKLKRAGIIR